MGKRFGTVALVATLVAAGALLGSSLSQWWEEPEPTETAIRAPNVQGRVRVEVLNGGGRSGVAREATGSLRDLGFDVVFYGNAGTFSEDPSVVIDRVGRMEAARWTAEALGIATVLSEPDTTRYVDVTVRLGPEWSPPVPQQPDKVAPAPWWDVRRYFQRDEPTGDGDSTDRQE